MPNEFDKLRRILGDQSTRSLLKIAVGAGFLIYARRQSSSKETPESLANNLKRAVDQRKKHDAWHARNKQGIQAHRDYFGGPGGEILRERALVEVGPEQPFGDEVFEILKGRFRERCFSITSKFGRAKVQVCWDAADGTGGLGLEIEDGRRWNFGFRAVASNLKQYEVLSVLPDVGMARVACRLLSAPQSPFATITLTRPNYTKVRDGIWEEYVALHPELADEKYPRRV